MSRATDNPFELSFNQELVCREWRNADLSRVSKQELLAIIEQSTRQSFIMSNIATYYAEQAQELREECIRMAVTLSPQPQYQPF